MKSSSSSLLILSFYVLLLFHLSDSFLINNNNNYQGGRNVLLHLGPDNYYGMMKIQNDRRKIHLDDNDTTIINQQLQLQTATKEEEEITVSTNISRLLSKCINPSFLSSFLLLLMTTTTTIGFPTKAMAVTSEMNPNDGDGSIVSIVTQSDLGKSVRLSVINGAKVADYLDLKWERLSNVLQDEKKCDPNTNRRLYDNGKRKDGTQRGNPVLGALCEPVQLKPITDVSENSVLARIFRFAEDAAVDIVFSTTSNNDNDNNNRHLLLQQKVIEMNEFVKPAFSNNNKDNKEFNKKEGEESDIAQERRENYNRNLYATTRAYGEILLANNKEQPNINDSNNNEKSNTKRYYLRNKAKEYDLLWGRKMLQSLAPNADRKDFKSIFPRPEQDSKFDKMSYDENLLLDALGSIRVALDALQSNGLISHYEISIPEDNYGEVVTIAVDDDVSINSQILTKNENKHPLSTSPVIAIVRSAITDKGRISSFTLDTFFIDPTTTKQELYKPTQLLISLSSLEDSTY